FEALSDRGAKRVGVTGLGTGALACYARPGDAWTFHEIDPEVVKLATDGRYFHFVSGCSNPRIVLGDARLTLQAVPGAGYVLLVMAVSRSHSVPIHLLPREALPLSKKSPPPPGAPLSHASSRYLDLPPLIAALAQDAGAPARHMLHVPATPGALDSYSSEVV